LNPPAGVSGTRPALPDWRRRLTLFLAVIGPGIITANVDNDAGGIATYSMAGAHFGYSLLWTMVPITLALIVVQEMSARLGAVSGKGLADLIRENYGLRITFYVLSALFVTDIGNTVAEFAGWAAALEVFGVPRWVSVPIGAVAVWWLVVKGNYKTVEKVFLISCTVYLTYVVSAFFAKPVWRDVIKQTMAPRIESNAAWILMIIGVVGTTIAPWMQFYLQSSVVERESKISDYPDVRLDVIIGSIMAVVVAFFIVVACAATLHREGIFEIASGADAARALAPLAGQYASWLFALGLANASLFAASILPLATAYSVCEGLGLEAGVDRKFGEAPEFYWLYTGLIVGGAGMILLPGAPLLRIILVSQIMNGVLLPFVLVFMILLVNRRSIMGEFTNGRAYDAVAWVTVVVLVVLTVLMVVTSLVPGPA